MFKLLQQPMMPPSNHMPQICLHPSPFAFPLKSLKSLWEGLWLFGRDPSQKPTGVINCLPPWCHFFPCSVCLLQHQYPSTLNGDLALKISDISVIHNGIIPTPVSLGANSVVSNTLCPNQSGFGADIEKTCVTDCVTKYQFSHLLEDKVGLS